MIFDKRALLALGVACAAAGPFSRVGAVRGDEKKSPLDTIARKLDTKAVKEEPSSTAGGHTTSKGSKNPPNSSEAHKESTPFFVASAACAQKCISAEFEPDHHLLTNAIQHCDAKSSRQMWDIVSDGTFVKVKSVAASGDSTNGGWCLGVVPQVSGGLGVMWVGMQVAGSEKNVKNIMLKNAGEDIAVDFFMNEPAGKLNFVKGEFTEQLSIGMIDFASSMSGGDGYEDDDMCSNGNKLGLVSCDHPTAQWSSTDGQLISPFCWGIGHSSFLSVNEGCTDLHLSTTSDGSTAISRSEKFMAVTQDFIETIPVPTPAAPTNYPTYYPTYSPTVTV
jgi:hypothetical protein